MPTSNNSVKQMGGIYIKKYGSKKPIGKYYFRLMLGIIGIKQPIEYYGKNKRLEFERNTLQLWKSYCLNVPNVIQVKKSELYLSAIKGETCAEIFNKSIDFDLILKIFIDVNNRHELAIKFNEPTLCHVDANLGNILYSDNKLFHIDFEMGREYEAVNVWAEREITKLLISLSGVVGINSMKRVVSIFLNTYTHTSIVRRFINQKISEQSVSNGANETKYRLINLALDMKECMVGSYDD